MKIAQNGRIRVNVALDREQYDALYRRAGDKQHGLSKFLREAVSEKLMRDQEPAE